MIYSHMEENDMIYSKVRNTIAYNIAMVFDGTYYKLHVKHRIGNMYLNGNNR